MKTQLLVLCLFFMFVMCNEHSQTVYVTKSGTKYHNVNCKHLSKSSRSITFSDAKGKGYDACSVCKPITTTSIKKSTTTSLSLKHQIKTLNTFNVLQKLNQVHVVNETLKAPWAYVGNM